MPRPGRCGCCRTRRATIRIRRSGVAVAAFRRAAPPARSTIPPVGRGPACPRPHCGVVRPRTRESSRASSSEGRTWSPDVEADSCPGATAACPAARRTPPPRPRRCSRRERRRGFGTVAVPRCPGGRRTTRSSRGASADEGPRRVLRRGGRGARQLARAAARARRASNVQRQARSRAGGCPSARRPDPRHHCPRSSD